MAKPTTRQAVDRLVTRDPTLSLKAIADKVGVSPARVGQLMERLGYEWRAEWRKAKGGAK